MNDLVIKNCKLIGKTGEYTITIEDGKISDISKLTDKSDNIIDVNGQIVLPGLIDPHVHFRDPGLTYKENMKTGSMAAANGGFTTVIDMPNTIPQTNTLKAYKEKLEIVKKKSVINTLIHAGVNTFENMNEIAKLNPVSYKIFTDLESDSSLKEIFSNISKLNLDNPMITLHCEDKKVVEDSTKMMKEKGTDNPIDYAYARPSNAEDTAVTKVINLAKKYNLKIHICHLSSKKSLEIIKNEMSNVDISYEFTPHHLLLNANAFNEYGNIVKTNPPLRLEGENLSISNVNESSIIGTDHAPHSLEEKNNIVWQCPSGMPNIENVLSLLLTEVNNKRLDLKIIPKILSENAANRFNLKGKGKIQKGYDGDLTVIDLKKEGQFNVDEFYTKGKYSPFNKTSYKGKSTMTIVNGKIVMEDNIVYDTN